MNNPVDWRTELRAIYDEALEVDWDAHLTRLNADYGLSGRHALSTTDAGLPPAWFNGDIEAIDPGHWVLVIALNPAKPSAGYYGTDRRLDNGWDFWRRHNEGKWWYWRFFRPLVQIAAKALGEDVARTDEPVFATERMTFIELCPYASGRFALSAATIDDLTQNDPGFQTAKRFRQILINSAQPALVLINGSAAVRDVEVLDGDRLQWHEVRYLSVDSANRGRPKRLWHKQGVYTASHGPVLTVGFPFLRTSATHNSNAEITQLGQMIQDFICARNTQTHPADVQREPS